MPRSDQCRSAPYRRLSPTRTQAHPWLPHVKLRTFLPREWGSSFGLTACVALSSPLMHDIALEASGKGSITQFTQLLQKPGKRRAETLAGDALIVCAAGGDWLIAFASLWAVSHWSLKRNVYVFPLTHTGPGHCIFSAITLLAILSATGLYSSGRLLNQQANLSSLGRGFAIWSFFFFGFVTVLAGASTANFAFAVATIGISGAGLITWRTLFHHVISRENIASHLRQRILLIGWTPEAGRLCESVWNRRVDPCEIIGFVELSASSQSAAAPNMPFLGGLTDLPRILEENVINVAWLTDVNIDANLILNIASECGKEMVEFKIIPTYFPILLSAMHVEMVSGTPILGVDRLPLNCFHIRVLKRFMDIVGALFGLLFAGPIIACFCALVHAESPGPVFYRQRRMGRKGKAFEIMKIRSMRLDAEKNGAAGWSTKVDSRRLRIGGFMRKWNIDELPQFWNVLRGDMSLVGPRPERPEFISNFKHEIEHYNARHGVKPGLTGWAQVNGLRGDTDLSERIRYDLYYMEHWSPLFDLRVILLTFLRHKNAC